MSATAWRWRSCVLLPVGLGTRANGYAAQMDPDTGGAQTFAGAQRLSASGTEPASHLLAVIPATLGIYLAMDSLAAAGALPGMIYYRWEFDTLALAATNSPTATVGAAWGATQTLADAKLKLIGA